jgi:hypothetical protein
MAQKNASSPDSSRSDRPAIANGEALQRFEREINRTWDAMRSWPEIAEIESKYGPMNIRVITIGSTGVPSGSNTLLLNPADLLTEYRTAPPESWEELPFAEYNSRVSKMPEYFQMSPIRLLAHEVLHLTHPSGMAWNVGQSGYEADAIRFENRIINKYVDPNQPARRDHTTWRYTK